MDIYHQKESVINQFKMAYEENYLEDFEQRKRRVINHINDMEGNPRSYQYLLGTSGNRVLNSIYVHDQIPTLNASFNNRFEVVFNHFK
ncbi:hypothetical protein [Metabacillus herbersteinensis]|uniref:hypothetical protein n=1 Tax=Metabacillus herbersteinensis TaxID=283816 RepID=UPI00367341BD